MLEEISSPYRSVPGSLHHNTGPFSAILSAQKIALMPHFKIRHNSQFSPCSICSINPIVQCSGQRSEKKKVEKEVFMPGG